VTRLALVRLAYVDELDRAVLEQICDACGREVEG
jgi:hypothetical protein